MRLTYIKLHHLNRIRPAAQSDLPKLSDPNSILYRCDVYGAAQNVILKGQGAFLIGTFTDGTSTYNGVYPTIKFFDFTLDKVNRLMGGTGTGIGTSPDNSTAGSVLNSTLPNS